MTAVKPPIRLVHDPKTTASLRAMLDQARSEVPTPGVVAAFTQRVDASFATQSLPSDISSASAGAQTASSVAGTSMGKLMVYVALLAFGAIGVSVFGFGSRGNNERSVPSTPIVTASKTIPLASTLVMDANAALPPSTVPLTSVTTAIETPKGAPLSSSSIKSTPTRSELALLELARRAIRTDPKRALQLTREHARLYPKGTLCQEREVIAIEALDRLGRHDDAQARKTTFGEAFPDSAHQARLKQSLKP